jgi:HEAT repeat protein
MADDPKEICSRLDNLAGSGPPAGPTLRQVEALLRHHREGVQVKAAQTLAKWCRPSSKTPLRELLFRTLSRRHGTSVRGQVARALAPLVNQEDAPWVLDLYFSVTPKRTPSGTLLQINALLPLVSALPVSTVAERIREEGMSSDANVRRAALFAAHAVRDRSAVEAFVNDPAPDVRATAANLLMRLVATPAVSL